MKSVRILLAGAIVMALGVAAFAAAPVADVKVRVVDVSVLGFDKVRDNEGLMETATMSIAENPKVFPPIKDLVLKVGPNKVSYSPDVLIPSGMLAVFGSIDEMEKLEFISIPYTDQPGKFDLAIVTREGKVIEVDSEVLIDYPNRTIVTSTPLPIEDGDTVLVFVKNAEKIIFDSGKGHVTERQTDTQRGGGRGGTGGGGKGGGGGGNGGGGNGR